MYTSILKTKPDHCEANYNIGVLAFDLGKRTEAMFFKRAIDSNSSIELYWKSYVQALLKLDKVDEAKSAISKAKTGTLSNEFIKKLELLLLSVNKIQPERCPQEHIDRLLELYHRGKFAKTIETGEALTKIYPNTFALWNLLGAANWRLGNTSEAVIAFEKVIQLNPSSADGHNNLGNALQDQGKLEQALDVTK